MESSGEELDKELTYHVFVGNQFVGSFRNRRINYLPDGWYSRAYFCEDCGEVWARIVTEGHSFYCQYAKCARHGHIEDGGGSLIERCSDHNDAWPVAVLNRELQLWAEQCPELWY